MTREPLHLLAPNGVVQVIFARALTAEQALAVLDATRDATSAKELEQFLLDLGSAWGVFTLTETVTRKSKTMA
jgi:hypothetical protein